MPKARLVFDGDNVYIGKDARIYGLKDDIASKIDEIPGVINSLDSTSTTDALSANMGRTLQDQINGLSGTGKFLSTWDCTTGLPGTNPQEDPYTYKVGDYYVVSVVGSTNYKPHGGTFTQGVPSTTVETENVGINDKYYFDGADWVRIPDTAVQISIDTALSTTSTNAVENRAIATAINGKQDIIPDLSAIRNGATAGTTALQPNDNISQLTNNVGYQTAGDVASAIAGKQDILSAGDGISLSNNIVTNTKPGAAVSSTAPSNPTEGLLWYDTVNDVLKSYDGSNWNEVGSDAADINTKTFYLSSTSDLTNAQAALDWYLSGKNPIIVLDDKRYFIWYKSNSSLWFFNGDYSQRTNYGNSTSGLIREGVIIAYSDNTVTEIRNGGIGNNINSYLTTGYNYSNPYIPEYDGSPATKKYVDDKSNTLIFNMPTINNDISDIINGLDSGKCVILTEYPGGGHEDIYIVSGINYNQSWLFATRYIGKVGVAAGLPSASTVKKITYNYSTHVVTAINTEESTFVDESEVLTKTNTTSYTPTANYHPATKKYVDDKMSSGSVSPSNPVAGQLWYDTTNNILMVYDGTNWVEVSSSAISDAAFSSSWDGDTTHAPSKNAIYDVLGDVETLLANL